ncbi:contractile injection system protein, VgrG/Pvc8 family [Laribacter hongkongensis]|uniref:contractile injection system protein, VgrG/Pvc8 family n=1 Tax=Laribacter hongkongensis TaxID=168471 RepID=UPI001EFE891C|nr:contractile injection system protein, VgrG/Pvc8 family [Laribacter hongkongensis]MCG9079933.1 phage late control D family protein [Laribacter hongkongensis]
MSLSDLLDQGEALVRSAADKTAELADRVMDLAGAERLLQPVYRILLHKGKERRDITANFDSRLMSLSLTDNRGFESDQVDIVLDDADGQLDLPPRGGIISVQLGWKGQPLIDKGSYTVDEVEHSGAPDILTIRARATDLRAGMATKREKSWHKTTVGKVVGEIAKANGLTPAVPDWLARRPVAHMDQTSESDANLLTRLAGQHDAVATVKAGRLIFCKAGVTKRGKPTKRKKLTPVQMAAMEPSSANVKVLRHIYASETTAIQAAKAAWEKIQRGVAEFSITLAHGRPELFPELPARVEGVKPSIDGCD